jgi:hypothetical protein
MNGWWPRAIGGVLLLLGISGTAQAQRTVRWDAVDVTAHLDATGQLRVTEAQTIVFDGAWNGGERRFSVNPGQQLWLTGLSGPRRGGSGPMAEDARLDDVGDYSMRGTTLRWRSRLPSDPPFNDTRLRYEIRYVLSGVLGRDGDRYVLNHDFAFADRDGPIDRLSVRITLDPIWQPLSELKPTYTAGPLPPGRSFVLRLPLAPARAVELSTSPRRSPHPTSGDQVT